MMLVDGDQLEKTGINGFGVSTPIDRLGRVSGKGASRRPSAAQPAFLANELKAGLVN
jgi:hypothetical protein